jgi:branched-chain amino acid aminotransferase
MDAPRTHPAHRDWAVRYGWGAFETIRFLDGCPLFLSRHLDRFFQLSAALLLPSAEGPDWWYTQVLRQVERADFAEGAINLYWTRGEPPRFAGHRIVVVRPLDGQRRRLGRIWIAPWRIEPGIPGIGAKTMAFLPYTFASFAAQAAGFDDAILLNTEGRIADGSAASILAIEDGQLVTPSMLDGALPGITRAILLEQAARLDIPAREASLRPEDLCDADCVLLTSVLRGITTVYQIDDRRIETSAAARQLIARLRRSYRRTIAAEIKAWRAMTA